MKSGRVVCILAAAAAALSLAACGKGASTSTAAAPPANTVHFVNSPDNAKAPGLAQHYVDFSFDYPKDWSVDPETGTASAQNFVKVGRETADHITTENFAVGNFSGSSFLIPMALGQFENQMSGWPGYKRLSLGPTTINGLAGQQLAFTATPEANGKPLNMFGRLAVIPAANNGTGVILVMLGTAAGGINSIDDLGTKGELPVVLSSFKLGK